MRASVERHVNTHSLATKWGNFNGKGDKGSDGYRMQAISLDQAAQLMAWLASILCMICAFILGCVLGQACPPCSRLSQARTRSCEHHLHWNMHTHVKHTTRRPTQQLLQQPARVHCFRGDRCGNIPCTIPPVM